MKKHRSVAYTLDFLALGFVILAIAYHHNGENQSRTTAILSAVTHSLTAAYFHIQGHKDKPEHEKEQPETDAKIEDTPTQNGYSEVAKEGYPAAILSALALTPMVESLKKEGKNQAQIIKILWGISKGGSETYKRCVNEFKALIK